MACRRETNNKFIYLLQNT